MCDPGLIEIFSRYLPRGSEKNHGNLRVAGILAEILTGHYPNKVLSVTANEPAR
jgi:hypothetical protein